MEKCSEQNMELDCLLLNSEKKSALEQMLATPQSIKDLLTCQFDKLYTRSEGEKDEYYLPLNFLQRAWIIISSKMRNEIKAFDLVTELVTVWLKEDLGIGGKYSQEDLLILSMHSLISLFLKENWTGKSFLFVNAEIWYQEERVMKSDPTAMKAFEEKLANISFDDLSEKYKDILTALNATKEEFDNANFGVFKDKDFSKTFNPAVFAEHMVINGEECYQTLKLVHLYLIVRRIADVASSNQSLIDNGIAQKHFYIHLLRGRLAYLHAQVVTCPTESLRETTMSNYGKAIEAVEGLKLQPEMTALLYVEYAQAVLHFYKYSLCEEYLDKAKKLLGIEFSFTGKMGVRTKYQQFKVSQLTLEVEKASSLCQADDVADLEHGAEPSLPKIIKLDDIIDNILYEKPIIDHEGDKKELTVFDHILVVAIIRHIQRTSPMDDVQREHVLAYLHQTEHKVKNWSVLVMSLITKALTEFGFMKKRERSLLQLHQISDEWNVGKEDTYERQKYLFPLNFPSYIEFQTIIIDKYLNMGMVMTACQIYEQLQMLEECVECYFRAGHFDKAKELAEKLMQEKPTPKLYCILGDVQKDPTLYLKAYEVSGNKYARAQRSLGKYYYNQKQLDKAAEHLKLALELNEYHVDSWSLLGYIYMATQKYPEAIHAYGKVVQIDSSQAFSWANLSNLYMITGKKGEAFSTIEQAAKLNDNRWKVWVNYAAIAFENQKFSKFVRAVLKLIDLDKCEVIDDALVKRLVVSMNSSIESVRDKPEEIRSTELLQRDISIAFQKLLNKMPQRHSIWKMYSDFLHFEFAFYSIKKGLRELDPMKTRVFLVEEPLVEIEEFRKGMLAKRFEATLKECQAVMKIGWETDVEANKQVYDATLRLLEYSRALNDERLNTQLGIHLKAVQKILQECIGDQADLTKLTL